MDEKHFMNPYYVGSNGATEKTQDQVTAHSLEGEADKLTGSLE